MLKTILARSRRIVFFGGAGVSTASGIPDFRSAGGLYHMQWAGLAAGCDGESVSSGMSEADEHRLPMDADGLTPEMILSKSFFYLHPEAFFDFYRKYMVHPEAKPNAAHRFLYRLETEDRLRGIVTQNIDGLHKAAGNKRVYEIHGSVQDNYCLDCNAWYPLKKIMESSGIPRCDRCGGVVKPSVVLYGEPPDKYVCIGANREISQADTLIVAGTSLSVEPAASFLQSFDGKHLIVINREPTPADEKATLVIRGDVEKVLGD